MNGQVQMMVMNLTGALPHVRAGRLRALGVTTVARAPEVPAITEAGLPGYEAVGWFGIAVRAGTPPEIVSRLNTEINTILATDGFRQTLRQFGGNAVGGTPDQFADYIRAETAKWATVVRTANIRPD